MQHTRARITHSTSTSHFVYRIQYPGHESIYSTFDCIMTTLYPVSRGNKEQTSPPAYLSYYLEAITDTFRTFVHVVLGLPVSYRVASRTPTSKQTINQRKRTCSPRPGGRASGANARILGCSQGSNPIPRVCSLRL